MAGFLIALFLGWAGGYQFYKGNSKMGFIYLFTLGLFGIGWIIDIFTAYSIYKKTNSKAGLVILSVLFIYFILFLIVILPQVFIPIFFLFIIAFIATIIYTKLYFKSEKFISVKNSISDYINDCNGLNSHIENLRSTYADFKKTDYGSAEFHNIGKFNYKKRGISNIKYAPNIYDCSKSVCDNARKQPFKYICKYFNIKSDEETLENFESVLNNFLAAEDGKALSKNKREEILSNISSSIPWIIKKFCNKRLQSELGFDEFIFDEVYFPTFSFRYVSAGGNSGNQFDVTMNIDMLERFINYLSELVKFKKSAAGQRRLMTPQLRRQIIARDDNTCKICGNSTYNEPNLLLEVDHIVPVSKGGITSEDNLQTLCWKCNRHKSNKM